MFNSTNTLQMTDERGQEWKMCLMFVRFYEITRLSLFLQTNQRKTYEYILKHGAHLAHVTDAEHLLASSLSIRENNISGTRNSLEPHLNKQNTLAQIGTISISKVADWSLGGDKKKAKKYMEDNFIQENISSTPVTLNFFQKNFICMC